MRIEDNILEKISLGLIKHSVVIWAIAVKLWPNKRILLAQYQAHSA